MEPRMCYFYSMDRRSLLIGLGGLVAAPAIVRTSPLIPVRGVKIPLEPDGFANAPTGAPQYPTYFTNLNGISPYPVRPPWKVAGVDYRVGINTGISLKDPATISSSIATVSGPLGAGQNANTLNIAADNVTLDGYDFTLNGGYLDLGRRPSEPDHLEQQIAELRCVYEHKLRPADDELLRGQRPRCVR